MDPDALLKELRELRTQILHPYGDGGVHPELIVDRGIDLAEKFNDLDEWFSKGGFLPEDWRKPPKPVDPINVFCTHCESYPTHRCVTTNGKLTSFHKPRIQAAITA